jgi:hypothetical protein
MIFPLAATEQVRGDIDMHISIINGLIQLVLALSLLFYCGFAALHSVSHVEDPSDRMAWIALTVIFNVVGSLIYYLTKYQDFRAHGLGGLIRPVKKSAQSFYRATPSELKEAEQNAAPNP